MSTKIVIFGIGRMGLTHFSILNQLLENCQFTFIDPNNKVSFFAKKNLNVEIYNSDIYLRHDYDFALICTPPMFHIPILNNLIKKNINNIFVEKPFGGISDDFSSLQILDKNITIGYVLRFNPIVQWVKQNLHPDLIESVEGYYFSNTIEKKPNGWRNGKFSGVTNEAGAHIIDLCVFLFGISNPILLQKDIRSVISDVDDVVTANFIEKSINFNFHFDWVNKEYRKPVFKFMIYMKDGSKYKFDQQKIEYYKSNILINSITSASLKNQVPFYLRGIEFTNQMIHLIGSNKHIAKIEDALITRSIIKKIIL